MLGREIDRAVYGRTKTCHECRAAARRIAAASSDLATTVRQANRSKIASKSGIRSVYLEKVTVARNELKACRAEALEHLLAKHDMKE